MGLVEQHQNMNKEGNVDSYPRPFISIICCEDTNFYRQLSIAPAMVDIGYNCPHTTLNLVNMQRCTGGWVCNTECIVIIMC